MNSNTKKTILLVEDEVLIAMAIKMTLEEYGFQVITAHNGNQAIEVIDASSDINLILMDIDLGKGNMDGTEAAQLILKKHDVPVVFLSNHTEREVVEKTEGITSYGYIVKNTGETVLIASLKMAFKLFAVKMREKEKEEALKESEDFLNRTGNIAKVGGWQLDLEAMTVLWTKTTGRIHELPDGYFPDLEEAINFYHLDDREIVREFVNRAIEEGEAFEFETRLITAKGRERWVRAIGQPIMEVGKCVQLSGTFQDITERKQVEMALEESEKKFRLVTETIEDVFWISTPGVKEMVYVSPAYEKIWKQSIKNLYKSPFSFLDSIHPDDKDGYIKCISDYHSKSKPYSFEYRILRKGKSVRWISERGFPIENENREYKLMTGVCSDITDRKQAEETLRENQEQLNLIFNATTDYMALISIEKNDTYRFASFNNAYWQVAHFQNRSITREKLIGMEIQEAAKVLNWPDVVLKKLFKNYKQIIKTGHTLKQVELLPTKGGKLYCSLPASVTQPCQKEMVKPDSGFDHFV
jgi:PAS domain S-box-containing protein